MKTEQIDVADALATLRRRFEVAHIVNGSAAWNAKGSWAATQILKAAETLLRKHTSEASE